MKLTEKKKKKKKKVLLMGRSLFCFSPKSKIRRCARTMIGTKVFEGIILFLILASTILLAMENPLDDPVGTKK